MEERTQPEQTEQAERGQRKQRVVAILRRPTRPTRPTHRQSQAPVPLVFGGVHIRACQEVVDERTKRRAFVCCAGCECATCAENRRARRRERQDADRAWDAAGRP